MELVDEVPLSTITRGAKWCPEGNFVLSNQEDTKMRVFRLEEDRLVDHAQICEGELIYDFTWFPNMRRDDHETMCFFTASRDHPIHLRDANDCRLRATYRGFNHLDEVAHCYSIAVCPQSGTIVGGYKSAVWFFDLTRPGRQVRGLTTSTRKGKGPKGIIGAVAPHITLETKCLAVGTYQRHIALYHETDKNPLMLNETVGTMGGVTSLVWQDESVLVSGHRQDGFLRRWDIRYPEGPLERIPQACKTNQRLLFTCRESAICYGNDDGMVNITDGASWRAHESVAVTAAIHPMLNMVLTSGGTRTFPNFDVDLEVPTEPSPPTGSTLRLWQPTCK
eukprot:GEMP01078347.1.p1 GENE.GEMP01078347.1~~GEMP01078347.1.p1  ORF type:complete len:335 (+),score=50.13 GEMP01078347.1:24-1028(+)